MTPLLPLGLGLLALAGGAAILRSFGPRYRVGRLLATTPLVPVAEAVELARTGTPRYVRVDGRIDSETEFEDADHRPLVLRRTRLQARRGRRWATFETVHEAVAFAISEGLDTIGVDGDGLTDGLVVVPRETSGVVGDLGDRAPDELADDLPARVVVEHVSSVEHATVLGVPQLTADGRPLLAAGLGRPLVLTTLERDEAERILAAGGTLRVRSAAGLLALGAACSVIGIGWAVVDALL